MITLLFLVLVTCVIILFYNIFSYVVYNIKNYIPSFWEDILGAVVITIVYIIIIVIVLTLTGYI